MNVIYILTNVQYPGYVKIGYTSDLKSRLSTLNTGMLTEFVPYAVYETEATNADLLIHQMIGLLNPMLRAARFGDNKVKLKEFFKLEPEEALMLLRLVAKVSGTEDRLHYVSGNFEYLPVVEQAPLQKLNMNIKDVKGIRFLCEDGDSLYSVSSWYEVLFLFAHKAAFVFGEEIVTDCLLDMDVTAFHKKTYDIFSRVNTGGDGLVWDGLYLKRRISAGDAVAAIAQMEEFFPAVGFDFVMR